MRIILLLTLLYPLPLTAMALGPHYHILASAYQTETCSMKDQRAIVRDALEEIAVVTLARNGAKPSSPYMRYEDPFPIQLYAVFDPMKRIYKSVKRCSKVKKLRASLANLQELLEENWGGWKVNHKESGQAMRTHLSVNGYIIPLGRRLIKAYFGGKSSLLGIYSQFLYPEQSE